MVLADAKLDETLFDECAIRQNAYRGQVISLSISITITHI